MLKEQAGMTLVNTLLPSSSSLSLFLEMDLVYPFTNTEWTLFCVFIHIYVNYHTWIIHNILWDEFPKSTVWKASPSSFWTCLLLYFIHWKAWWTETQLTTLQISIKHSQNHLFSKSPSLLNHSPIYLRAWTKLTNLWLLRDTANRVPPSRCLILGFYKRTVNKRWFLILRFVCSAVPFI